MVKVGERFHNFARSAIDEIGNRVASALEVRLSMNKQAAPTAPSARVYREKTVPVLTVESFYNSRAEQLLMKLDGPRVGFHRKIREPTINRPGLALSGFYTYFAEKRVQVLGAAEHSYLKSLAPKARVRRFRALCARKIPCLVVSRGFHLDPAVLTAAAEEKIAVFRTPMITMKFINAATIALAVDFSPTISESGCTVVILSVVA